MPVYDLSAKIEESYLGMPVKTPTAQVQILSAEDLKSLRKDPLRDRLIAQAASINTNTKSKNIAHFLWSEGRDARNKGDIAIAVTKYMEAISVDPNNSLYYNDLGVALAMQKRDAEAIDTYKRALASTDNFDPITYYNLAKSQRFLAEDLEKNGDRGRARALYLEARQNYAEYLRLEPNGKMVKSAQSLINAINNVFLPRLEKS